MSNNFKEIRSRFWNSPIKNPTQTSYLRFLRTPSAKLGTDFEKSQEDFNKQIEDMNKPIKTGYSEFWEE